MYKLARPGKAHHSHLLLAKQPSKLMGSLKSVRVLDSEVHPHTGIQLVGSGGWAVSVHLWTWRAAGQNTRHKKTWLVNASNEHCLWSHFTFCSWLPTTRAGKQCCRILAIVTKHKHVWPAETLARSSYHLDHLLQVEQLARDKMVASRIWRTTHTDQLGIHNLDCCFSLKGLLFFHIDYRGSLWHSLDTPFI